jgi:hypothetical protein
MYFLVDLLILVLVAGLIYWLLTVLPVPQPFKNVAIAIFIVICIIWLLGVAFGSFPAPHPLFLR